MTENLRLSKISIREVKKDTNYASNETLMESLNTIRATWDIPIDKYFQDLLEEKVDSISFTKDEPYYHFFARRFNKSLSVTIKETERVIDFSTPLQEICINELVKA